MLDRLNNRIYIKYKENDIGGSIIAIICSAVVIIGVYNNIINGTYKFLKLFFSSKFTIVLSIIVCVIVFIIGSMGILFSSNVDFHIDLYLKKLVLIQGRKPFWKYIDIDFNKIKEINILRTQITIKKANGRYKNVDNYVLEIYDNDLNAYSCYDNMDIEKIIEIANELSIIFDVKVIDRTEHIDYEGFRQRII
jgi:hypothetical protein